jgi:hypothetical protein
LSNAMVSVLRSLCSRSSVGHGCAASFMEPFLLGRDTAAHAIVGRVERLRNPSIHVAIEAQPVGYGAIAAKTASTP